MIRNIRVNTLKLRNKNYKQTNTVSIAQIKLNSKQAFQNLINQGEHYDSHISSIYHKMTQEQTENPILVIPKKFDQFLKSKLFKMLLRRILQYMQLLEQYEEKYKLYAAQNKLKSGNLMLYQSHELEQKCKEVSYAYMGVLLSHGQAKFIFKDQYFFQTMIYFISQVLKETFDDEIYPVLDSELNRIFRTNTFNLISRRYQQDKLIQEYPELKDSKYNSTSRCDDELLKRLKTHKKFHYAVQIKSRPVPSLTKPLDIHQSASTSIHSRSPLIASYFPSQRQKLFNFSRQNSVRDKIVTSMRQTRSFSVNK